MIEVQPLTGNEAVAEAVKQCNVDVVAAYPITPSTIIVERISEFVANGEIETEYVTVESEHSAMTACIAASLTGARVFTATASQGLALMHEMLYEASGFRCPIVMAVANRSLAAPINIHSDHSDAMGSRDSGWLQLFAENVQEAYDLTVQAFKIAENLRVLLPVMIGFDGFILTHALEGVFPLKDDDVKKFLPPREVEYALDPNHPITVGAYFTPEYYFEVKYDQEEAIRNSITTVVDTMDVFSTISGRKYEMIEPFQMEDAEIAIVCMGSTAGQAKFTAEEMRKKGKKVGVLKIRLYRPFPYHRLIELTRSVKVLAVLDRAYSFGAPGGPLFSDIRSALYDLEDKPVVFDVVYGLGGRDMTIPDLENVFEMALDIAESGRKVEDFVTAVGVIK